MSGETLALADELAAAYETRRHDVVPPSARGIAWDLPAAYAVGPTRATLGAGATTEPKRRHE